MNWEPGAVVAHRGASLVAPENTMAGFRAAREFGAEAIEFDVHRTLDGALAVIHDFDVSRTTDGAGAIFDLAEAEVRELDAGAWFGDEFAGERVPLLDEVLALSDLDFELEIKSYGSDVVDSVLEAVTRAGVLQRVKFTGWNLPLLVELKRRCPEAKLGLFSKRKEPWMTDAMHEHVAVGVAEFSGADVFHTYAGDLTKSIVDRFHDLGGLVQANDAASGLEAEAAFAMGADFVSANDVKAALQARSALSR